MSWDQWDWIWMDWNGIDSMDSNEFEWIEIIGTGRDKLEWVGINETEFGWIEME